MLGRYASPTSVNFVPIGEQPRQNLTKYFKIILKTFAVSPFTGRFYSS